MARSSLPTLTPALVRDEQKLAWAIDKVLGQDPELRRMRRKVIRRQDRLRKLVTKEAWKVYLKIEEAETARLAEASVVLVTWAFKEGQKSDG